MAVEESSTTNGAIGRFQTREVEPAGAPVEKGDDKPAQSAETGASEQDGAEIEMRDGAGEETGQAPHHGGDQHESNAAPVEGGRGRHETTP